MSKVTQRMETLKKRMWDDGNQTMMAKTEIEPRMKPSRHDGSEMNPLHGRLKFSELLSDPEVKTRWEKVRKYFFLRNPPMT